MTRVFNTVAALTLLAVVFACSPSENKQASTKQESIAPEAASAESQLTVLVNNAELTNLNGEKVMIDEFKGKVVMLDFWETWCTPCLRSMPVIDRVAREYEDDFVVLAISPQFSDEKKDVVDFVNEHDYRFEFLLGAELAKGLKIQGIPFKVYVDPQGQVIKTQMGISGDDEADYQELKKIVEKYKS